MKIFYNIYYIMAENSGLMKKHSNATNFTKDSVMTLANSGTFGFAGVANKALFQLEKKRIEALNKKVIENCTDIKNIASILQRNYDSSSLHLTEDELLNIVNITRRSDDEICENSLNYDSEMDTVRDVALKVKKRFSPSPPFISNDSDAIAAAEDPSGRIFKEINSEQLKNDSPPVSRPGTPETPESFDFDNKEKPQNQQELSTTKLIDFDKGGGKKKSRNKKTIKRKNTKRRSTKRKSKRRNTKRKSKRR